MRRNIALGLAALVAGFGFWLGEAGSPPWAAAPVVGALGATFAVALAVPGKLWIKSVCGFTAFSLCAATFFLGWLSFTSAFSECVEKGDEVRVLLSEHQMKEGQLPEHLNELKGFNLCGRILHPTLLEYKKTRNGYALSFRDWLVEHKATESEPFMAQK